MGYWMQTVGPRASHIKNPEVSLLSLSVSVSVSLISSSVSLWNLDSMLRGKSQPTWRDYM